MKPRLGIVVLPLLLSISLGQPGATAQVQLVKSPYIQNVSATSAVVMWQTEKAVPSWISLSGPTQKIVQSERSELHEVTLDDLSPGTRYQYSVHVGDSTYQGQFATAPQGDVPFRFLVYGDTRSNTNTHRRVVAAMQGEGVDFALLTGDMVDEGDSQQDWQEFFDVEADLMRDTCLFPAIGNHDRQGRGRTADNFRGYFSLPENSPDPERYYAFTHGNARFLVLDSNTSGFALTTETEWLEEELVEVRKNPELRHIFVLTHHPMFSVSLHGGNSELRKLWVPLFEKYNVDAVFSGHDHVYSRAEQNGVTYFVTGGAGAPLYPRKASASKIDTNAVRVFERTNHFLRVTVLPGRVEISARRLDGSEIESVQFDKPTPTPLIAKAGAPAPTTVKAPSTESITTVTGRTTSSRQWIFPAIAAFMMAAFWWRFQRGTE